MGNDIGIYDNQGYKIATIDSETGEIRIEPAFIHSTKIHVNITNSIPIIEIRNVSNNITMFQIALPIKEITNITLHEETTGYQKLLLEGSHFGVFNGGICIQNTNYDCIIYTHPQ